MIALRREPFDFGILPASFLLPRAESVAALRDPTLYDQITALANQAAPPSRAHALVLEAIVILLTPSSSRLPRS